jgi:hypothetical protein
MRKQVWWGWLAYPLSMDRVLTPVVLTCCLIVVDWRVVHSLCGDSLGHCTVGVIIYNFHIAHGEYRSNLKWNKLGTVDLEKNCNPITIGQ